MAVIEEWRAVVGYGSACYEVSNLGRVRRVGVRADAKHQRRRVEAKLKAQHADKDGYMGVVLYEAGTSKYRRVHQLVLEAFVGPCPEGHETDHEDHNTANNTLANLRWMLQLHNNDRRKVRGTVPGTPAPVVRQVRAAAAADPSRSWRSIGRELGLHHMTVRRIALGQSRWYIT